MNSQPSAAAVNPLCSQPSGIVKDEGECERKAMMGTDLEAMSREQLIAESMKLREGIRKRGRTKKLRVV